MRYDYSNYGLDDAIIRTFMIPAVEPFSKINMKNNQNMMGNNKFVMPNEGFLRGNMEAGTYIPYKNMNYIKPSLINEKQKELYKLQEMAFAAHDINLYLDTHPNDSNSIKLYNEYLKQEKMLNDEYERKYGPIDLSDTNALSMTPWSWINKPWPWEK